MHKIPSATAGSQVGRIGKVKKATGKGLKEDFGSVLRELVVTIRIGRMELIMRTQGSLMIGMNFVPFC